MERNPNSSYLQKLELERLKLTRYDRLNGEQVAKDLEDHRELWRAARLVSYLHDHQLQSLYAMEFGDTFDDTLLISTTLSQAEALQALAENWRADVVGYLSDWEAAEEVGKDPEEFQVAQCDLVAGWSGEELRE